ncbi:MAG: hypothetical protein A2857_00950 [Candidatus Levybacteria bacterium RIFCSPHIGHO2_01_FULL_36_15]|nr:MAG: hypothetical protein A2857_00950 [Candidatus Levybacteria bacterium RIFCSPHIGHO2_01_FULL_36_15]
MDNPDKESIAKDQPKTENPVENSAASSIHPHTQKFYMLLIILGVIFLASIFLAGLYFIGSRTTVNQQKQTANKVSPTPDLNREPTGSTTTANWKTYNGDTFSFKYPSKWIEETSSLEKSDSNNIEVIGLRINTSVFGVRYKNISFEKSISSNSNIKYKPIIIGGNEAFFYEVKGDTNGPLPEGYSIITIIVKGVRDTSYSIFFNGDRKEFPDSLIDQILSTFKFLD